MDDASSTVVRAASVNIRHTMSSAERDRVATNPAVRARGVMGRSWLDVLDGSSAARSNAKGHPAAPHRPIDGG